MLAHKRKEIIIEHIQKNGDVKVASLSKEFGTSEVTIRRDLQELEKEGLLKRMHGGAVAKNKTSVEPSIFELGLKNVEEKHAIAKSAYDLIKDNDAIIIDSSTTAGMIAKFIKAGDKTNITIVTNSFRVVMDLLNCDKVELIHIGGQVRANVESSIGLIAENTMETLRVDKAFVGINGIDFKSGLTTPNLYESRIKTCMVESANQTYVLADHSKFNSTYLSIVCPLEAISCLITDDKVDPEYVALTKDRGVKIIVAATENSEGEGNEDK